MAGFTSFSLTSLERRWWSTFVIMFTEVVVVTVPSFVVNAQSIHATELS